jgi:hypothetical protein
VGVGPKAQDRLQRYGVETIGDLARTGESTLESWFGEHGRHMHRLSHGIDERDVQPGRERKSISHEDTYAIDVVGVDALRRKLLSQATRVADRLVAKKLLGRRVQLKIRDNTFSTQTRQCTLSEPTNEAKRFYDAACKLLDAIDIRGRAFRLTGVGVSALVSEAEVGAKQLDLLQPEANVPKEAPSSKKSCPPCGRSSATRPSIPPTPAPLIAPTPPAASPRASTTTRKNRERPRGDGRRAVEQPRDQRLQLQPPRRHRPHEVGLVDALLDERETGRATDAQTPQTAQIGSLAMSGSATGS